MSIFDPFTRRLRPPEKRSLQTAYGAEKLQPFGLSDWPSGPRAAGFHDNPVVHRCVRMISQACASVPLVLRDGAIDCQSHPILALLKRPNQMQDGVDLRDALMTDLLLHGNAYLEQVGGGQTQPIDALYRLRPDRISLVCDAQGWPKFYDYQVGGKKIRYDANQVPAPIVHLRLGDPQQDHLGASPLKAAQLAIEIHTAANRWNKSLFENAARPSGALVYRGKDGQRLTDDQFDRLKQELQDNFQGARNAGRPLLLEGGLEWASISMSPQDMDFIAAKHSAARDIALAFGVPPMLLGIPGDNNYSNYAEANRAFWRQTVLPLNERIVTALERHLCAAPNLQLHQALDEVPALSEERQRLWKRVKDASFLSDDEKRALVGYGPKAAQ